MNAAYLTRACAECPFRRSAGAVRLTTGRIEEIAGNMLSRSGGEFHCHKTTTEGGAPRGAERHCAGALVFAEKHSTATQMMRIAERIGLYDPRKLQDQDDVFDSIDEMLATAIDAERPRARRRGARR